jgi:hypothetical protein
MSNLNSVFDLQRGYPYSCALEDGFEPDYGVSLPEGTIVTTSTRQLPNVKVLKMKSDATGGGSPPTLVADDAGKAYVVNTWGAGFNAGDIVEWDGDSFVIIVPNEDDEPPLGTRIIVIGTGAAGSFAAKGNHIMTYTAGTPNAWVDTTTPTTMQKVRIVGSGGRYHGLYYDFHDAAWVVSSVQRFPLAKVVKLTSGTMASTFKDDAWVVVQGNDQWDAEFANVVTCLKLQSGCTFKIAHTAANTLVPGTLVQANAGVLEAYSSKWPVGLVVWSNGVSGSGGQIAVASM